MRMTILFILSLVLVSLPASGADKSSRTNWSTMDFGAFSFRAPPGMTNVPVRGIDSLVGRCVRSNIILTFDYGPYTGGSFKEYLENWKQAPRFKLTDTTIDGRASEIVSYQVSARYETESKGKTNVIRVKIPNPRKAGSSLGAKTSLSMTTYCESEADYAIAKTIFESIRFNKSSKAF